MGRAIVLGGGRGACAAGCPGAQGRSDLTANDEVLAADLQDPDVRDEWEATALARLIAVQVVRYRVENALTQTALGRKLGMTQPQVARIEAGEHNPGMETLRRLAHGLGWTIHIDISPDAPLRVSAVA